MQFLQDENRKLIDEAGKDPKEKWKRVRKLLYPSDRKFGIPSSLSPNMFVEFFLDKVLKIRRLIISARSLLSGDSLQDDRDYFGLSWSSPSILSPEEVSKLLASMSNKSSPLDAIPTSILKSCPELFSQIIATLANKSFGQGRFSIMLQVCSGQTSFEEERT